MDKDLQNIEDLFRSALDDNEEMPSAKVWDAVDQRLDKETVVTIKKKYKTLKRFSLLLLLLLIGLSIYELNTRYGGKGIAKTNNPGKTTITDNDKINRKEADEKSIAQKEEMDSKNIPATTLNTITENSNPDNNKQVQSDDPSDKVKQNQSKFPADINSSPNSSSVSKTYRDVVKTTDEQKIKAEKTFADRQNNTTPEVSGQINHPLSSQKQFDPLHPEKISRFTDDSAVKEKMLQSLASFKNNSLKDNITSSQQARKKPVKPSRFSISGFFSPDIASYRLDDEDVPGQPDNSEDIKRTERHESSSTFGLLLEYNVNKRWTIQSGITFSNTNIAVEPRDIYAQRINNGDIKYRLNISSGYAYLVPSFQPVIALDDTLNVTAITHKLRYIGVPIAVKYSISSGKFKIEAMTGVSANFLTKGKLETEIQKGPNNEIDILNKIEGLKSIYLSGQAGIGAEYKLTGKVSFILMPTARFALMPINKGSVVKTYPYSFGIASGLKMRF